MSFTTICCIQLSLGFISRAVDFLFMQSEKTVQWFMLLMSL